jgi:hypothetical protein
VDGMRHNKYCLSTVKNKKIKNNIGQVHFICDPAFFILRAAQSIKKNTTFRKYISALQVTFEITGILSSF